MVDRNIKDSSSGFDHASTFRAGEALQNKIRKLLKLEKDSLDAELAVGAVERAIRTYKMELAFTPVNEERDRISRINRAATELLSDLGSLSPMSNLFLFKQIGGKVGAPVPGVLPMLEELEKTSSLYKEILRDHPREERYEREKGLAATLVEVIETYYAPDHPRRGRNSTFKKDSIEFVWRCFKAAGVSKIPGDESLYRRYIMPPRKWLRPPLVMLARLK